MGKKKNKEESLLEMFGLPKWLKGKSFADASKCIKEKIRGKDNENNTPEDIATEQDLMNKLQQAQEYVKEKEGLNNSDSNPSQINTQEAESEYGQNKMFLGGLSEIASGAVPGLSSINSGMELLGKVAGGNADTADYVGGAAKTALGLVPGGSLLNPLVDIGTSFIGGKKREKEIADARANEVYADRARNSFAYGGNVKKYAIGGNPTNPVSPGIDDIFMAMPKKSEKDYENKLANWGKRMKMTPEQLNGFVSQKESDKNYYAQRDAYYADSFSKWREGMTGNTPNSKLTQSDPVYQKFWADTKNEWKTNNPRPVNDIVKGYQNQNKNAYGGKMEYKYGGHTYGDPLIPHKNIKNRKLYNLGGDTDPINPLTGKPYSDAETNAVVNEAEEFIKDQEHYARTGRMRQKPISSLSQQGLGYSGASTIQNPNANRDLVNNFGLESKGINIPDTQLQAGETPARNFESAENMAKRVLDNDTKKFNPGKLLRYAPAAMNAAQLAGLKKPKQESLARANSQYNRNYVDEKALQNTVQGDISNMRRGLTNLSGGSASAARANLLASQLRGSQALSDAMFRADAVNRAEEDKFQNRKFANEATNINQSNAENQINAQNLGAYESQRSQLMAQLGNDLGGIGREELFREYPELMGLDYGADGENLNAKKKRKERLKAARKLLGYT